MTDVIQKAAEKAIADFDAKYPRTPHTHVCIDPNEKSVDVRINLAKALQANHTGEYKYACLVYPQGKDYGMNEEQDDAFDDVVVAVA